MDSAGGRDGGVGQAAAGPALRYSAATDIGRQRDVNEDALAVLPSEGIWAVADGMGGHEAGDLAAQIVTNAVLMMPEGLPPTQRVGALEAALNDAHRAILSESRIRDAVIGATVVALLLAEGQWTAVWCGDSRAYLVRGGRAEMLSFDHSTVGEMVAAGRLTWEQAEAHPLANQITRAVGVGDAIRLDGTTGETRPGDRLLLCSDGLSRYVGIDELGPLVADLPIDSAAEALIDLANGRGGADNISAIVIEVP